MANVHIKFIAESDKKFANCIARITIKSKILEDREDNNQDAPVDSTSSQDSINPAISVDISYAERVLSEKPDDDGNVIINLPEEDIISINVELICDDVIIANSPILRNEDGNWPTSSIILVELSQKNHDKNFTKCEKSKVSCGLDLKKHHALKQNRYIYISKVEQPPVCVFPSISTAKLNADERKKLEKAISLSSELAADAAALEEKERLDAYFTNPRNFTMGSTALGYPLSPVSMVTQPQNQGIQSIQGRLSSPLNISTASNLHSSVLSDLKEIDIKHSTIAINELLSPAMGLGAAQVNDAITIGAQADIENIANSAFKDLPARYELTCKQPLHWDEAPIPQSCEPFLIHVLEFVEEVIHTGYQYGKIIHMDYLLPCEDIQLATVSFKREETTSRKESMTAVDSLTASISRARDIDDLHKATVKESMRGSSSSRTGGFGVGLAIPVNGGVKTYQMAV